MQTKTITLYEYSELSPEAKKKALKHYIENDFDDYGLQVHLDNEIEPLLERHGIKPIADVKGYASEHARIYYSLGHCQGDGVCFENTFTWKKYTVYIKHADAHYYHSHSTSIEMQETDNLGFHIDEDNKDVKEFEEIYQSICKELEKSGYAYIEDMQSEAYFIEECNNNEWTFREDGTREQI